MGTESVNLLPDSLRARQVWQARGAKWTLLGVAVVLLVYGYSLLIGRHVAAVKRELVPLQKQVAEKQELNRQLAELDQELARAVEKRRTLDEVVDQRNWAYVFADVAESARGNAWLERTKFAKVKVKRRSDKGDGSIQADQELEEQEVIQIVFSAQGYAESNFDLANFMARLKRSHRFDEVELNYSELTEVRGRGSLIRFEIEGTVS